MGSLSERQTASCSRNETEQQEAEVAEQDRLRREWYQRRCDETWQRNLERWAEEERRLGQGCHVGPGDPDYRGR
jgi:hypothetical protein